MNGWMKIFIGSIVGSILLSILGGFWFSEEMKGEVVATGSASEILQFEGEADQFYDVYAEDAEIQIVMTSERGTDEFTHLDMCPGATIGMSASCGDQRGSMVLVGDITVGAFEGGTITLNMTGTGDVTIVKTGIWGSMGAVFALCSGCCIGPIIAIISGIKAFRKDQDATVYVLPTPVEKQDVVFAQGMAAPAPTHAPPLASPSDPPTHLQGTPDGSGYEWLEHEDARYWRAAGSGVPWQKWQG